MFRVLIVEDEHIIRKDLVYVFDYQTMGCVVVGEASNCQMGIEKIKLLNPDIVVTDINMPILDAFQMLEGTRDYTYSTIIVFGYSKFSNAQHAMKYGVSEFIVKPIDGDQFAEALERAKQQSRVKRYYLEEQKKKKGVTAVQLIEKEFTVSKNEIVKQMVAYVEENYSERFVLQDVASVVRYSPTLLQTHFKKYMNTTFNDYVNRYRIQIATELLKEKELKIYEM